MIRVGKSSPLNDYWLKICPNNKRATDKLILLIQKYVAGDKITDRQMERICFMN